MQTQPRLSKSGLELVKRFEGLRQNAARLNGGGWTIGYGHTASARQGAMVSAADAEALLIYDLRKVAQTVSEAVFTPLSQNQFDAIVAFAFNVGVDNFLRSNVLKRLNEGSYLQAAAAIELWRKADIHGDSIVVDGLVRRRAAEKLLFLTPSEGFRPVPTPVVRAIFDPAQELTALQPGLAQAADVRVSLNGETAEAEVYAEPPPVIAEPQVEPEAPPIAAVAPETATEAAVRAVTAQLNKLFAEDAPPPPAPEPVIDEPPVEVPVFPQAEPQAESASVFELTPEPEPAPEPEVRAEPEPVVAAEPEAAPPPSLFSAPPPRLYSTSQPFPARAENDDEEFEAPEGPFGRRYATLAERAAAQPVDMPRSSPPLNLGVLALGVFGAALFCGALATMVFGRATLVNLALGLLGVVCMVPSGLKLLTQLFNINSSDTDEA